jgi:hypothetical protein
MFECLNVKLLIPAHFLIPVLLYKFHLKYKFPNQTIKNLKADYQKRDEQQNY